MSTDKSNTSLSKKNLQGRATRQGILAAAEMVFYERGVSASTLELIAERAQVTRGAIYWHFKNKDEILKEILNGAIEPLVEKFRYGLNASKKPDIMILRRACMEPILMIARSPSIRRKLAIILIKCEYTDENTYLLEQSRFYHDQTFKLMRDYLKTIVAHDRTLVLSKPADVIAEAFLCYSGGALAQLLKHPDTVSITRHLPDYMDVFLLPLLVRRENGSAVPLPTQSPQ